MESLESRHLLSSDLLRFEVVDGKLEIEGGTESSQWRLERLGDLILLHDDGNQLAAVATAPAAEVTGEIVVAMGAGDDLLEVDLGSGDFLPSGGVRFDGGDGVDSLHLTSPGYLLISAPVQALDADLVVVAGAAGDGSGSLEVAATVTVAGGNVSITAVDASLNQPIDTDGGSISVVTERSITIHANGEVNAGGGDVHLSANQQATPASGGFAGVHVNGGVVETSGSGQILIQGRGGDASHGSQHGVVVSGGGRIGSAAVGGVTISGQGGASAGNDNYGVVVNGSDALITSGGAILVNGGGGGTGFAGHGVAVYSGGKIAALGDGTVTVTGQGSVSGNSYTMGVVLVNAGAEITSAGGHVNVSGTGGGTSSTGWNYGVVVESQARISAGGDGQLTVSGQGSAASGSNNHGVLLRNAGTIQTSGAGTLAVTGIGRGLSTGGSNTGVLVESGSQIAALGTGVVSVQGTGGSSSGNSNLGVLVTGSGAQIITSGGDLVVTGHGGGLQASTSNYGVAVWGQGRLSVGGDGNLTVTGEGGTSTGERNYGVQMGGGSMLASGAGTLSVTGVSGEFSTGIFNVGVRLDPGSQITGSGVGPVIVQGTGRGISGNQGTGVRLDGTGALIAAAGPLTVIGESTATGATTNSWGVDVTGNAKIRGTAANSVTVIGTGAKGTGNGNTGVFVRNAGSEITSAGGAILVTGVGGGASASASNAGVRLEAGGVIGTGASSVRVEGTGGSASGNFNHGVVMFGTNTRITSGNGDVTVIGTAGGSGNSAQSHGVQVFQTAAIVAGGSGNVSVQGTGGKGAGTNHVGVLVQNANTQIASSGGRVEVLGTGGGVNSSTSNHGVAVSNGGRITASGLGDISVQGQGGAASGQRNYGVFLSSAGTGITSSGGNVEVVGQGGGVNSSPSNLGVYLNTGSQISAAGDGSVSVQGSGGSGEGERQHGVYMSHAGTRINSERSDVEVIGVGGGQGPSQNNIGMVVEAGAEISSGGTGKLLVQGEGGTTPTVNNTGLLLYGGGIRVAAGGELNVHAIAVSGSHALELHDDFVMTAGDNSPLTLRTDSFHLGGANLGLIQADSGIAIILPHTSGTQIALGGADVLAGSPRTLGLSATELAQITAGSLQFGSPSSGSIAVDMPIAFDGPLSFVTGDEIVLASHTSLAASPLTWQGNLRSADSLGTTTIDGDLHLVEGSSLSLILQGTSPGEYDQLVVTGNVQLGNSVLELAPSFTAQAGQQIVLLDNQGNEPVQGKFAFGLSRAGDVLAAPRVLNEGNVLLDTFVPGLQARITYTGGDGNDVVLVLEPPTPDVTPVLNAGLIEFFDTLKNWSPLFSIAEAIPAQPALPLGMDELDQRLNLSAALDASLPGSSLEAPQLDSVDFGDPLRQELERQGFEILSFSEADATLEARYVGSLGRLSGETAFTPELLQRFGTLPAGVTLDGSLEYDAELQLDLIVGIDGDGFYVRGDTALALETEAVGSFTGAVSYQAAGLELSSRGVAYAALTTTSALLSNSGGDPVRYRTEDLELSLEELTQVTVSGDLEKFSLQLAGKITVPALTQGSDPFVMTVTGSLDRFEDSWRLDGSLAPGEAVSLNGFELRDLYASFSKTETIDGPVYEGMLAGELDVPLGSAADLVTLSFAGAWHADHIEVHGSATLHDWSLGAEATSLLWFDEATVAVSMNVPFSPAEEVTGGVTVSANELVLHATFGFDEPPAGEQINGAADPLAMLDGEPESDDPPTLVEQEETRRLEARQAAQAAAAKTVAEYMNIAPAEALQRYGVLIGVAAKVVQNRNESDLQLVETALTDLEVDMLLAEPEEIAQFTASGDGPLAESAAHSAASVYRDSLQRLAVTFNVTLPEEASASGVAASDLLELIAVTSVLGASDPAAVLEDPQTYAVLTEHGTEQGLDRLAKQTLVSTSGFPAEIVENPNFTAAGVVDLLGVAASLGVSDTVLMQTLSEERVLTKYSEAHPAIAKNYVTKILLSESSFAIPPAAIENDAIHASHVVELVTIANTLGVPDSTLTNDARIYDKIASSGYSAGMNYAGKVALLAEPAAQYPEQILEDDSHRTSDLRALQRWETQFELPKSTLTADPTYYEVHTTKSPAAAKEHAQKKAVVEHHQLPAEVMQSEVKAQDMLRATRRDDFPQEKLQLKSFFDRIAQIGLELAAAEARGETIEEPAEPPVEIPPFAPISGALRATGLSGTISSTGRLQISAATANLEIGKFLHVAAVGLPAGGGNAAVPGLRVDLDPEQSAPDTPFVSFAGVSASIPSLETLPSFSLDSLSISRNGIQVGAATFSLSTLDLGFVEATGVSFTLPPQSLEFANPLQLPNLNGVTLAVTSATLLPDDQGVGVGTVENLTLSYGHGAFVVTLGGFDLDLPLVDVSVEDASLYLGGSSNLLLRAGEASVTPDNLDLTLSVTDLQLYRGFTSQGLPDVRFGSISLESDEGFFDSLSLGGILPIEIHKIEGLSAGDGELALSALVSVDLVNTALPFEGYLVVANNRQEVIMDTRLPGEHQFEINLTLDADGVRIGKLPGKVTLGMEMELPALTSNGEPAAVQFVGNLSANNTWTLAGGLAPGEELQLAGFTVTELTALYSSVEADGGVQRSGELAGKLQVSLGDDSQPVEIDFTATIQAEQLVVSGSLTLQDWSVGPAGVAWMWFDEATLTVDMTIPFAPGEEVSGGVSLSVNEVVFHAGFGFDTETDERSRLQQISLAEEPASLEQIYDDEQQQRREKERAADIQLIAEYLEITGAEALQRFDVLSPLAAKAVRNGVGIDREVVETALTDLQADLALAEPAELTEYAGSGTGPLAASARSSVAPVFHASLERAAAELAITLPPEAFASGAAASDLAAIQLAAELFGGEAAATLQNPAIWQLLSQHGVDEGVLRAQKMSLANRGILSLGLVPVSAFTLEELVTLTGVAQSIGLEDADLLTVLQEQRVIDKYAESHPAVARDYVGKLLLLETALTFPVAFLDNDAIRASNVVELDGLAAALGLDGAVLREDARIFNKLATDGYPAGMNYAGKIALIELGLSDFAEVLDDDAFQAADLLALQQWEQQFGLAPNDLTGDETFYSKHRELSRDAALEYAQKRAVSVSLNLPAESMQDGILARDLLALSSRDDYPQDKLSDGAFFDRIAELGLERAIAEARGEPIGDPEEPPAEEPAPTPSSSSLRATGLNGTISSTGRLQISSATVNLEIGKFLHVAAVGLPASGGNAAVPGLRVDLNPNHSDPNAPFVFFAGVTASIPSLESLPSFSLESLSVTPRGVEVGAATLSVSTLDLGFVEALGVELTLPPQRLDFANPLQVPNLNGVTLAVTSATLLPDDQGDGVGTVENLTLSYGHGAFVVALGSLDLDLPLFDVSVENASLYLGGSSNLLLRAGEASVTLDGVDVELTAVDLRLFRALTSQNLPDVRFGSLGLSSEEGILSSIGLGDLLPIDVTEITIGSDAVLATNELRVSAIGKFKFDLLKEHLPFDPVLEIRASGDEDAGLLVLNEGGDGRITSSSDRDNHFSVSVIIGPNGPRLESLPGHIVLGVENWEVGAFVFEGAVYLGNFASGGLPQSFGGYLQMEKTPTANPNRPALSDLSDEEIEAGADPSAFQVSLEDLRLSITGGYTPAASTQPDAENRFATLDLSADLDAGLRLKFGDFLELYGFGGKVSFVMTDDRSDAEFDPDITATLDSVSVDLAKFALQDYFAFSVSNATFNFTDTTKPLLEVEGISMSSERLGLSGTVTGLELNRRGVPQYDTIDSVSLTVGGEDSVLGGVLGYFPLTLTGLGFQLGDGFYARNAAGDVTGIAESTDFKVLISGGMQSPENWPADLRWPITATVTDLEVDIQKLLGEEPGFPLALHSEIEFGLEEIQLTESFTIGGKLLVGVLRSDPLPGDLLGEMIYVAFDASEQKFMEISVDQLPEYPGAVPLIYGRVQGVFNGFDISGGVDLVLSPLGPTQGRLIFPTNVPLGTTPLILSQVSGGINFGVTSLPSVEHPRELVTNPVFFDPFEIDSDTIRESILKALDRGTITLLQPFSVGIAGTVTTTIPGIVSGEAAFVVNVATDEMGLSLGDEGEAPEINTGVRFLGTGNVSMFGMPMGRVGMLLDQSKLFDPELSFALTVPSPDSPLGFLMNMQAELFAKLDVGGANLVGLVALRTFIENLVTNVGDEIFDRLAEALNDTPSKPLAVLLAGANPPQGFVFTGSWIRDQLLGENGLLPRPDDLAGLVSSSAGDAAGNLSERMVTLGKLFTAFIPEIPSLFLDLQTLQAAGRGEPAAVQAVAEAAVEQMATLSQILANSLLQSGSKAWDSFNPSLLIEGAIRPVLFGIPMPGSTEASIYLDKTGLRVNLETGIVSAIKNVFPAIAPILQLSPLGPIDDRLEVDASLQFPDPREFLQLLLNPLNAEENASRLRLVVDELPNDLDPALLSQVIVVLPEFPADYDPLNHPERYAYTIVTDRSQIDESFVQHTRAEEFAAAVENLLTAPYSLELVDYLIDIVNPLSDHWQISLLGSLDGYGFENLMEFAGIAFGPQYDDGNFRPREIVADRLRLVVDELPDDLPPELLPLVILIRPEGYPLGYDPAKPNEQFPYRIFVSEDALLDHETANNIEYVKLNRVDRFDEVLRFGGLAVTGDLRMPRVLSDPLGVFQAIHDNVWEDGRSGWIPPPLPEVSAERFANFQQFLAMLGEVGDFADQSLVYARRITEGLTHTEKFSRVELFLPSPAGFLDLDTYRFPSTNPESDPFSSYFGDFADEAEQSAALDLFLAGYLTGWDNLNFLGMNWGSSRYDASLDGITLEAFLPLISGLRMEALAGSRELDLLELAGDLLNSPLVTSLTTGAEATAAESLNILDAVLTAFDLDLPLLTQIQEAWRTGEDFTPLLPESVRTRLDAGQLQDAVANLSSLLALLDLKIPVPIAKAELSLGTENFSDWVDAAVAADTATLARDLMTNLFGSNFFTTTFQPDSLIPADLVNLHVGVYTPFASQPVPGEPNTVEQNGGFRFGLEMNVPNLLERTQFTFEIQATESLADLDALDLLGVPNFQATATAAHVAIPGLPRLGTPNAGPLLALQDFSVEFNKNNDGVFANLSGKLNFLDREGLNVFGQLKYQTGGALVGVLKVQLNPGDIFEYNGLVLNGDFFMHVNTTGQPVELTNLTVDNQLIERVVLPAGASVYVRGGARLADLALDGEFRFAVHDGVVRMDATASADFLGNALDVAGSVQLTRVAPFAYTLAGSFAATINAATELTLLPGSNLWSLKQASVTAQFAVSQGTQSASFSVSGQATIPGVSGSVFAVGNLAITSGGGISGHLTANLDKVPLLSSTSLLTLSGVYEIELSKPIGQTPTASFKATDANFQIGDLFSIGFKSLTISSTGAVSATSVGPVSKEFPFGIAITLPEFSFSASSASSSVTLNIGAGSVTLPGVGTRTLSGISFQSNGTFHTTLLNSDGEVGESDFFLFGGFFGFEGRLDLLSTDGRVLELRLQKAGNDNPYFAIIAPGLNQPILGAVTLPEMAFRSDGTVTSLAGGPVVVDGVSFGNHDLRIASSSLSFGHSPDTGFHFKLAGGEVRMSGNKVFTLPAIQFDSSGTGRPQSDPNQSSLSQSAQMEQFFNRVTSFATLGWEQLQSTLQNLDFTLGFGDNGLQLAQKADTEVGFTALGTTVSLRNVLVAGDGTLNFDLRPSGGSFNAFGIFKLDVDRLEFRRPAGGTAQLSLRRSLGSHVAFRIADPLPPALGGNASGNLVHLKAATGSGGGVDLTLSLDGGIAPIGFVANLRIINEQFGYPSFGVTGGTISIVKGSNNQTVFRFANAKLQLPVGSPIDLPTLSLTSGGFFGIPDVNLPTGTSSIPLPTFNLGNQIKLGSSQTNPGPAVTFSAAATGLSVELNAPYAIEVLGSNMTLAEFHATSSGDFAGKISGQFTPPGSGYTLGTGTFAISRKNQLTEVTINNTSLNTGVFSTSLSGYVRSDGDFDLTGSLSVAIGNSNHLRLTGNGTATVRRIGSVSTFRVQTTGVQLRLPFNDPFSFPDLNFGLSGSLSSTAWSTSVLKLGNNFQLPSSSSALGFVFESNNGVLTLRRSSSFSVEVLPGATLTFRDFHLRSDGDFAASVTGTLTVLGKTLASGSFTATRNASTRVIKLEVPSTAKRSLDIGFLQVDVNGHVSSNGSFSFTGSKWVDFSALGNGFQGHITVTVSSTGGFSGSFSGSAIIAGTSYASATGSLTEAGCLSLSASTRVWNPLTFRWETIEASQTFALDHGACGDAFAIPAIGINGYIADALVFFDANGNGLLDYFDFNGNGVQDADEPFEPSARTGADGSVMLLVPGLFDRDANGQLTAEEGRLVLVGGTDLSTGLPLEVTLVAPLFDGAATVISPLSTVAERLMQELNLSAEAAFEQLRTSLGLGSIDLATYDPVEAFAGEDPRAPAVIAAQAQLHDTLQQLARLLGGSEEVPVATAADAALAAVAAHLAAGGVPHWSDAAIVTELIAATSDRLGITTDNIVASAAAEVIAAGNQQIELIPHDDPDFLVRVKTVQKVAQGLVADNLEAAAEGILSPESLVSESTGSALEQLISTTAVGAITPARIIIDDPLVTADSQGQGIITFSVRLSDPSHLPISLSYTTQDGSASAANGDYLPQSGILEFAPGEVEQSIVIEVGNLLAGVKTVQVQLFDPLNALLDKGTGLGALLSNAEPSLALDGSSLPENTPGAIVGTLSVLDSLNEQYTFTVSDERFEVIGNTLRLREDAVVTWATERSLFVTITASHPTDGELEQAFLLTVERVDLFTLHQATVLSGAAGAAIGTLSPWDWPVPPSEISLSDPRFELWQDEVRLRADQALVYSSDPVLEVTVTRTAGYRVFRDIFAIRVGRLALDVNAVASIVEGSMAVVVGEYIDRTDNALRTLQIAWGDPHDARTSTFELPRSEVLLVGQTILSSDDDAVLTVVSQDETGRVQFQVERRYVENGLIPDGDTSAEPFAIRVTLLSGNLTIAAESDVRVSNAAPIVSSILNSAANPGGAVPGSSVTLTIPFSDAGWIDSHRVVIDWGDGDCSDSDSPGDGVVLTWDHGNGVVTASHRYVNAGVYDATITLFDDDGGAAEAATAVVVTGSRLTAGGELQIVGSGGRDHINVLRIGPPHAGTVRVIAKLDQGNTGGPPQMFDSPAAAVQSIRIVLGDGDDHAQIHPQLAVPAWIDGGAGDDVLHGGSGDDTLLGGPGDDELKGFDGDDLLIGGDGADSLLGGEGWDLLIGGLGADELLGGGGGGGKHSGGDVLIAGWTRFDSQPDLLHSALHAWRDGWQQGKPYSATAEDVQALLKPGTDVFDDGVREKKVQGDQQSRDLFYVDLDGVDGDDDAVLGHALDEILELLVNP